MSLSTLAASALLAAAAGVLACPAPPPARSDTEAPVPPAPTVSDPAQPALSPLDASAVLFQSQNTRLGEVVDPVITTRDGWRRTWAALHAGEPEPALPPVDFDRFVVVVVSAGEQATGGHDVRVAGTAAGAGGGLTVHAVHTRPGPGCMSTQVMTAPAVIVRVPKPAGAQVRVAVRQVDEPC